MRQLQKYVILKKQSGQKWNPTCRPTLIYLFTQLYKNSFINYYCMCESQGNIMVPLFSARNLGLRNQLKVKINAIYITHPSCSE